MISLTRFRRRPKAGNPEQGYILLALMFLATLVVLTLAAGLPYLKQQAQRDQEQEMIHRGVQYSRAIRKYYKKFGRYPTSIDQLENTNNLRFLRKRYKDPVNKNSDFKLLHFGEVQMGFAPGIAGGVAPGANSRGAVPAPASDNQQSSDSSSSQDSTDASNTTGATAQNQNQNQNQPGGLGNQAAFGGQTFGGGPIVGVVSMSKKKAIRSFNNKDHYNQWQFIYDPGTDRGGLLNAPAQPALQNPAAAQGQPGGGQPNQSPQNGAPGVPTLGGPGNMQGPQTPQQPPDLNQPPQ